MHQTANPIIPASKPTKISPTGLWLWVIALLCSIGGVAWLVMSVVSKPAPLAIYPTRVEHLASGGMASMDSSIFAYSPGWRVDKIGADPSEPAKPWDEPSGTVTFAYTGAELDLLLAVGDYWGYCYVTVDGQPANLLPVIANNHNSQGEAAGYRTFYAPEKQTATGASEQWVRVARAPFDQRPHQARVEIWRSWGQRPLRAVAVDALPPLSTPRWPGIALLLMAGWLATIAAYKNQLHQRTRTFVSRMPIQQLAPFLQLTWIKRVAPLIALGGLFLISVGVAIDQWFVTDLGLALLAWVALQCPVFWLAALLFGLPFYYAFPLPILPGRALSLIDIGILGGLVLLFIHYLLLGHTAGVKLDNRQSAMRNPQSIILLAITSWALISTFHADHFAVALHEWRAVFLMASLFGLSLLWMLSTSENQIADQWWLIMAWIAGGTVVALVGLWQYASGAGLITAEGVWRVRAFYGSPNNLALYLERTLAVTLALALFTQTRWMRLLGGSLAVLQAATLLLTFSKGALLFGLPALFVTLWCGGLVLLAKRGESRRALWWIAVASILALLALMPFLATERFQRLLDFQQGTGFVRLQLWQSAWQMVLDHPWLGVGPDNFLYTFRSYYILPAAWQEPNLNHPHNWLLDWWTRLGLPGLALALAFFAVTIKRLWQSLQGSPEPGLSLGLLAAVVASLAHGLIDASYALPDLMIVWVLLANLPIYDEGDN